MAIDFSLLPNPSQSVSQGLKMGYAMEQASAERAAREAAAQNTQRLQADLTSILDKRTPTARDYAGLITKYPQFSDQFKQAWDVLNTEQQSNRIEQVSNVYAALEAGANDTAISLLEDQRDAAENSGDAENAKGAQVMIDVIKQTPEVAKTGIGMRLASMMGPDKFAETFTKLEQERREKSLDQSMLSAAQSKARKAATEADFAEAQIVSDLQKQGWDIYKIQEDAKVAKENSKIAAINAQLKRESNELKKQALEEKLAASKEKRDIVIKERTEAAKTAAIGIDNSLATIDRVLQNPELENVLGPIQGSKFYPSVLLGILSPLQPDVEGGPISEVPISEKRANVLTDIETIQGQQFITNLMNAKQSGATFGSLTEKEGAKLEGFIRSLNRRQGEQQFRENLREIQRLLLKSRTSIFNKSGVPETVPDTPAVQPSQDEIDQLLQQYGAP